MLDMRPDLVEASEFCAEHGLAPFKEDFLRKVAARSVRARRVLDQAYVGAPLGMENATIGLCKRIVDRSMDLVDAAICVAHTGFDAATEAACRAALEHIVTGLYILAKREAVASRLHRYMLAYVEDAEHRVDEWERFAAEESSTERAINDASRRQRRAANVGFRTFLDQAGAELSIVPAPQKWPNVWQRFVECGLQSSYRTVYAVLSAQAHGNAADLVHEFLAKVSTEESWEAQKRENHEFALAMLWYCFDLALQHGHAFSRVHTLGQAAVALRMLRGDHAKDAPHWVPAALPDT